MANLLWPGDHRAGETFSDDRVAAAMVRVERAWLAALVETGLAPAGAAPAGAGSTEAPDSAWTLSDDDIAELAVAGEDSGNPAVPLVGLLRGRLPEPAATWLHRGLTSQDVLDTALMLCVRDGLESIESALAQQVSAMTEIMIEHQATPMLARTLTQPAIETTVGVRAASWLAGLVDAGEALRWNSSDLPAQIGGAAGTLAAVAELAHGSGADDPSGVAISAADRASAMLGLAPAAPWHTARGVITRVGDALVACTDAWGRFARDVLTGSRAEIGELHEPSATGQGGSSTMPGKHNPVLAVLLRRTALAAPGLAATLHVAAAEANDDRPDGAWHAEWDTLRSLARRTLVAASHATELIDGLVIDTAAMARNLAAATGTGAEQRSMAALTGAAPAAGYRGAADQIIERVATRARNFLAGIGDTEAGS